MLIMLDRRVSGLAQESCRNWQDGGGAGDHGAVCLMLKRLPGIAGTEFPGEPDTALDFDPVGARCISGFLVAGNSGGRLGESPRAGIPEGAAPRTVLSDDGTRCGPYTNQHHSFSFRRVFPIGLGFFACGPADP